jgi:hypothetical protein
VDEAWFAEKKIQQAEITLPTAGDGSEPGDFVGPLDDTHCPVKVNFKVWETGAINGNSSGVRQLFQLKPPPRTPGAMASTSCHELGHSMGMTIMAGRSKAPSGMAAAKTVDETDGLYYRDGSAPFTNGIRNIGKGPHCATGVSVANRAHSTFNNASGSCIMFHAGGDADTRGSYCPTCTEYLKGRKLTDIKSAWAARTAAES